MWTIQAFTFLVASVVISIVLATLPFDHKWGKPARIISLGITVAVLVSAGLDSIHGWRQPIDIHKLALAVFGLNVTALVFHLLSAGSDFMKIDDHSD